jgi:hypothetical protein
MSSEPTGRRIRQYDVTISEVVVETADTEGVQSWK